MDLYKLDGKYAVACDDLMDWAMWMEKTDRKVARSLVGEFMVSTVFLGINHNFLRNGDPLLFETMVFLPDQSFGTMRRYSTWAEAEAGHQEIFEAVREQHKTVLDLTLEVIAKAIARPASA